MRAIVIGIHLQKEDVQPVAQVMPVDTLFASTFPVDEDRALADRDLLIEISGVRARLLDRATFIAVRYGLAVRDENELASKCAGMTKIWREILTRHRDEVEMTLKAPASRPSARPDRHDFKSGAEYLRALHEATSAVVIDDGFRRDIEHKLVPIATEHRWMHDSSSVELAMLVRRADLDRVREAGEALRRKHASVPFLLSGPWPLENFANDHQQ